MDYFLGRKITDGVSQVVIGRNRFFPIVVPRLFFLGEQRKVEEGGIVLFGPVSPDLYPGPLLLTF